MARRKLNAFTADDAGDDFTPTVKTLKAPDVKAIPEKDKKTKPAAKVKSKAGNEQTKQKTAEPEVKKAEPKSPAPKPEPEKPVVAKAPEPSTPPPSPSPKPERIEQKPSAEVPQPKPRSDDLDMRSVKEDGETDQVVQLVGFYLGNEEYGVEIQRIKEINRMVEVTSVPRTPDFVMGVMNLRGKVIPVINLRNRFGLPNKEKDKDTRIIVVELQNKTIGILVDAVSEVLRIPSSTIEPPPSVVTGVDADYIQGVGKLQDRLLILLDLDKILTNDEVSRLEEVET